MFPEGVRTACEVATDFSINSTKALYKFSCNASWIFFTSSMILFAPVLFETERAQMIELEMSQKQRVCVVLCFVLFCCIGLYNVWQSIGIGICHVLLVICCCFRCCLVQEPQWIKLEAMRPVACLFYRQCCDKINTHLCERDIAIRTILSDTTFRLTKQLKN